MPPIVERATRQRVCLEFAEIVPNYHCEAGSRPRSTGREVFMTPDEKNLISGLFGRLKTVDSGPVDREAEALIRDSVAAQPNTPYLLVQTVLVQEQALAGAQTRIADLEKQLEAAKSGA